MIDHFFQIDQKIESHLSLDEARKHYREWVIGVAMLSAALLISSYLAICQERMYNLYGKHPREAMFYTVFSGFWPGGGSNPSPLSLPPF